MKKSVSGLDNCFSYVNSQKLLLLLSSETFSEKIRRIRLRKKIDITKDFPKVSSFDFQLSPTRKRCYRGRQKLFVHMWIRHNIMLSHRYWK